MRGDDPELPVAPWACSFSEGNDETASCNGKRRGQLDPFSIMQNRGQIPRSEPVREGSIRHKVLQPGQALVARPQ